MLDARVSFAVLGGGGACVCTVSELDSLDRQGCDSRVELLATGCGAGTWPRRPSKGLGGAEGGRVHPRLPVATRGRQAGRQARPACPARCSARGGGLSAGAAPAPSAHGGPAAGRIPEARAPWGDWWATALIRRGASLAPAPRPGALPREAGCARGLARRDVGTTEAEGGAGSAGRGGAGRAPPARSDRLAAKEAPARPPAVPAQDLHRTRTRTLRSSLQAPLVPAGQREAGARPSRRPWATKAPGQAGRARGGGGLTGRRRLPPSLPRSGGLRGWRGELHVAQRRASACPGQGARLMRGAAARHTRRPLGTPDTLPPLDAAAGPLSKGASRPLPCAPVWRGARCGLWLEGAAAPPPPPKKRRLVSLQFSGGLQGFENLGIHVLKRV